MPRMNPAKPGSEGFFARYAMNAMRKEMGDVPGTWPIIARVPNLLRGWAMAEYFFDKSKLVTPKLKRLAQLKTSLMIGCPS